MLQPVIEKLIAEAESAMPTVSNDLESENLAKTGGWSGILIGGAAGAKIGAGLGIAAGPLGAIAGTIPGAVIGAVIGYFSGEKIGSKFNVGESD